MSICEACLQPVAVHGRNLHGHWCSYSYWHSRQRDDPEPAGASTKSHVSRPAHTGLPHIYTYVPTQSSAGHPIVAWQGQEPCKNPRHGFGMPTPDEGPGSKSGGLRRSVHMSIRLEDGLTRYPFSLLCAMKRGREGRQGGLPLSADARRRNRGLYVRATLCVLRDHTVLDL